jgi:protein associated with RNAse G/E
LLLTTNVRKVLVDGSQWASWQGYHIPISDKYFVIWTPAGTEMRWRPGIWISEKHQMSYFWPDAWFTIHVGYDKQTGSFLSGYCDVVLPNDNYTNTAEEMIYTDLYIDVVIREDYSVYTKDHEVFDRAAQRFPIIEQSRQQAFEVLDRLEEHAKHWTGPFAVMPQHLPRADWKTMSVEEIREAMRFAMQANKQARS